MTISVKVRLFLTFLFFPRCVPAPEELQEVNKTITQFPTTASSPQRAHWGRRQGQISNKVQSFDWSHGVDMFIAEWSQYFLLKMTLRLSFT